MAHGMAKSGLAEASCSQRTVIDFASYLLHHVGCAFAVCPGRYKGAQADDSNNGFVLHLVFLCLLQSFSVVIVQNCDSLSL